MPNAKKTSTKSRIMEAAISLFSVKGYTETTIREIAAKTGVTEASLYNYFDSKYSILLSILDDYNTNSSLGLDDASQLDILKCNPSARGILACITPTIPKERESHYFNELFVILQEQHRNPIVREYVADEIIISAEEHFHWILSKLVEMEYLRKEVDFDYWAKIHSSIVYAFANRASIGIGDKAQSFSGKNMFELLFRSYELMFKIYGTNSSKEFAI